MVLDDGPSWALGADVDPSLDPHEMSLAGEGRNGIAYDLRVGLWQRSDEIPCEYGLHVLGHVEEHLFYGAQVVFFGHLITILIIN